MEEEEGSSVRLVRCPKCENLLTELPEYSVYQCGGCGAVLRGKQSTPASGKRPLEKSDSENCPRVESSMKDKVSLDSSSRVERESDEFELGRRQGRTVHTKVPNLTASSSSRKEKREFFTESDQSRRRRLDFDQSKYGVSSESQETRHPFGPIRSRPVGIHRNASTFEKGRFGNLPYSNEGPSSSHLGSYSSFGDRITNPGNLHEFSKVQNLENDRAELLKKLDDLRAQLTRSCNVAENPNVRLNNSYPWPHQPPPMPHQPSHHQYLPPTYHDPFHSYNQEPILHRTSCSCSECYNMNWRPIPPRVRPFPSFNTREASHSLPGPLTYGPRQLPRHHAGSFGGDLDFRNGSFGRRYPRRRVILSDEGEHVSHPISGGAPFISCCNCFEVLEIPRKLRLVEKNNHRTIKCSACSALISLRIEDNKLVASVSSPISQQKVDVKSSNRSHHSSLDYDKSGYNFQLTDSEPTLSTSGAEKSNEQSPDSVLESQNDELTNNDLGRSHRTNQERVIVDDKSVDNKKSLKDALTATEIDVSLNEYLNCDEVVSREDDQSKSKKGVSESFFGGLIKKRLKDFSRSSSGVEKGRSDVFVNGQLLTDRAVKKAEKLAGPIHPGEYWYDSLAGFWGVMNQPCLGIIPPFIEEFENPMPKNCAAGNTRVFVNGRELNQKDLDLLAGRGLPTTKDRSYIIDISGKVVDEDTSEELDCLGKLAPTVEKVKHGFGMKVPKTIPK
ncbi:zinc-ribbon domain-containing protein [Artemisia annua]|uniref:Zinc-ribbon domain-containing protein n=1 Tax=Artemisia annua TaxID=35608 RepID=A0A2U1QAR5_ARTAN|nr:zinc-ribbon domain-containing protein [Artemisia annua]